MGVIQWFGDNSFERIQSAGIIGSFLLGAFAAILEVLSRKISNRLAVGQHHWDVWKEVIKRPDLGRILSQVADLKRTPVTLEERLIVTQIILNMESVFYSKKSGMYVRTEGLRQDVKDFLSSPVPRAVWERIKPLHNRKFVRFVEACLVGA